MRKRKVRKKPIKRYSKWKNKYDRNKIILKSLYKKWNNWTCLVRQKPKNIQPQYSCQILRHQNTNRQNQTKGKQIVILISIIVKMNII